MSSKVSFEADGFRFFDEGEESASLLFSARKDGDVEVRLQASGELRFTMNGDAFEDYIAAVLSDVSARSKTTTSGDLDAVAEGMSRAGRR